MHFLTHLPFNHKVCTYKEYHSVCPSSELGLPPTPHPQAIGPLPPVSGGRGTLAGEKGVGRVPIPTRGVHCGTLYMYVLCAFNYLLRNKYFTRDLKQSHKFALGNQRKMEMLKNILIKNM
jgi:hypothetical protein